MTNNIWQDRTVLVTGATGLLGGWMVPELLNRGANVVALVRDGVPHSKFMSDGSWRRVSVVSGSLEDLAVLRRAVAEYSVQTIFHLAAQSQVGSARLDPVGTLEANVRGTWNVLEAARLGGNPEVLVASSDKAYGDSDMLPYLESHPLQGRYPYEVSKSCTDLISSMYATTYGLPVSIVRCGNLFGGGDLNWNRTVPGLISATVNNMPFVIRSDGKYVRDFLYVEDAVDAYLVLAEALIRDRSLIGEAFNFSLGVRHTVLEIVDMVLSIMGRSDLRPVIRNTATNEIREQYLDATKAEERLNWKPKFGMEEGLRRTVDWYTDFLKARVPEAELAAAV